MARMWTCDACDAENYFIRGRRGRCRECGYRPDTGDWYRDRRSALDYEPECSGEGLNEALGRDYHDGPVADW